MFNLLASYAFFLLTLFSPKAFFKSVLNEFEKGFHYFLTTKTIYLY